MTKRQTKKSKYPSRYSPKGYVTAAQYIIELICENKAKKERKADLPIHFWRLEEWAEYYKGQLRATHALLKKFDEKAIINAVKKLSIYNIRPKWIISKIAHEQAILPTFSLPDSNPTIIEKPTVREHTDKIKDKFGELDE